MPSKHRGTGGAHRREKGVTTPPRRTSQQADSPIRTPDTLLRRARYLRSRRLRMTDPPCASFDIVTTLAGVGRRGKKDGDLVSAYFDRPWDVCALGDGSVLVTDSTNNMLRRVCRRTQTVTTLRTTASFLAPRSPIRLGGSAIAVLDSGHNKVRRLKLATNHELGGVVVEQETTVAGCGRRGHKDGRPECAMFNQASGLCLAADGAILVADTGNHAIRRIGPLRGKTGLWVTTLVGEPGVPGFEDGHNRNARLNRPTALAVDACGTIVVCDTANHSVRVLHPPIDDVGPWTLTTVAGSGAPGFVDGEGSSAQFHFPSSVCIDQVGLGGGPWSCCLHAASPPKSF